MANRNILMTHYDLDGVGCDIVLSRLFEFNKRIKTGYNRIEGILSNGNLMFYDACIVSDLSLKQEQIQQLINEYGNKFLYADHHSITKAEIDKCVVSDSTIIFDDKMSATAKLFNYFMKMKNMGELLSLVTYIDSYDMWRHKTCPTEFKIGHELNVLFWNYKYDYFFNRFGNGMVSYTPEENDVLAEYYDTRTNVINETEWGVVGKNSIAFIGVDQTYINEYSLVIPNYDTYYMIYTEVSGTHHMSLRSDRKDATFGENIQQAIRAFDCVTGGGGHKNAAGISFRPETNLDDIFDVIEYLNALDEKRTVPDTYDDIPY